MPRLNSVTALCQKIPKKVNPEFLKPTGMSWGASQGGKAAERKAQFSGGRCWDGFNCLAKVPSTPVIPLMGRLAGIKEVRGRYKKAHKPA